MDLLMVPNEYKPLLDIRQTETAIKVAKDNFERILAENLNLQRISAPLFVDPKTGLNDDLNGVERAVSFDVPAAKINMEIVHSLAKWKRMALKRYGFTPGEGLYTDMNAIRRDEDLDNLHSVYVDQWDWEKVISKENRTMENLKNTVKLIVDALYKTQNILSEKFAVLKPFIKNEVFFISSQQLEDIYPNLSPKERENTIAKEKGTVFITQIGKKLKSGEKHDGRAPDYDDWDLNGDILIWYPVLQRAIELSSMGIRVDEISLTKQLKEAGQTQKAELDFHKKLLNCQLPLTIGGGIGQSRLCMVMLQKAHIGEVQASVWSEKMHKDCEDNNIILL
ncbi:MAG: aspartate--ammonia ligase [Oscillospiraceae bacterium]